MVATYTYDALGRRIGIDDSGTQTWTVFNGKSADANPYADFNSSGDLKMRYLDGLAVDEVLARTDSSGNDVVVLHRPARLGGRRRQHRRRASWTRSPTTRSATSSPRPTPPTPIGSCSPGWNMTRRLGFTTTMRRYYDAAIGRFVSQDPKGFAAGDTNLYRYVGNEPADHRHRSGGDATPGHF